MGNLRVTNFVHNFLNNKIKEGSIAIDATMGNGHDTIFLSNLVGNTGKVFSFDIQKLALENTKELIQKNNIDGKNINLINDGHENIHKYIKEPIQCAMFNLGYLPAGDKGIITKSPTTIKAISTVLDLLSKGGIISIIIYYGHEGGLEEKNNVLEYIEELHYDKYTVLQCNSINHKKNPPIVVFIEKK